MERMHSLSLAMGQYSIEPRTRKYVQGYALLSFARKYKSNSNKIVKQEPVEEIIIPPEKKRNIKIIKISIIKMEHYRISKLLNDSIASKFVTKKWIEVSDLSSGQ